MLKVWKRWRTREFAINTTGMTPEEAHAACERIAAIPLRRWLIKRWQVRILRWLGWL